LRFLLGVRIGPVRFGCIDQVVEKPAEIVVHPCSVSGWGAMRLRSRFAVPGAQTLRSSSAARWA
jgi:hypothetical protein